MPPVRTPRPAHLSPAPEVSPAPKSPGWGWGGGGGALPLGGVFKARGPEAPWEMASPRAQWSPVSFGGPVRARKPGGVRTKGREKLPVASPPSCLPRPLPSSPAPSSFKPRLARVVSVQSRPPPSEEMAEEPEPQVKGARPPPAPGPGAPHLALRSPPEPPSSLPCSLAGPPPRMTPAPPGPRSCSLFRSSRAPPPHPASERFQQRGGAGRAPGVYSVLPSHSLLGIVRMAWGRGSPPSPAGT